MSVDFFYNGISYPLTEGYPEHYEGYTLHGGLCFSGHTDKGCIVLQEVDTGKMSFRILHIHADAAARIKTVYHHEENMLFIRAVPDLSVLELIKGSGPQPYQERQFSLLFGRNWQSVLDIRKPGDYFFFDCIFREEGLSKKTRNHPVVKNGFINVFEYIPDRAVGRQRFLSLEMHRLLINLRNSRYAAPETNVVLEEKLTQYLSLALLEPDYYTLSRSWIRQRHWEASQLAKSYIEDHLDEPFTIPQLSRKAGLSATLLKRVFPRITGFTIDDYHRYLKLKRTFEKLAVFDTPVKSVIDIAGYSGASAFTAAFKKCFLCLPSEFNREEWNTGFL